MATPAASSPAIVSPSFACVTNARAVTTVLISAAVQAARRLLSPAV